MPIEIQSKYNYRELAQDLGKDYDDLIAFLTNGKRIEIPIDVKRINAVDVIDQFKDSILQKQMAGTMSNRTVKYYLSFLNRFKSFIVTNNNELLFTELNEEILYNFFMEMASKKKKRKDVSFCYSQSSLNTYIIIVKRLCTFAFEKEFTLKNLSYKFKKINTHYLPRYFNKEQIKDILKEVDNRRCPLLWRTLFITLLGTGLRVSEIEKLKIGDINFEDNWIFVLGKGNKERYVPLYPFIKQILLDYLSRTGVVDLVQAKSSFVFSKCKGPIRNKRITVRSIQYNLHKICKKFNLDPSLTVHSFRHTFAVNCLKKSMNVLYLSQILGHKSPSTPAIYTKLFPKDLQSEISDKFPFPFELLINELHEGDV